MPGSRPVTMWTMDGVPVTDVRYIPARASHMVSWIIRTVHEAWRLRLGNLHLRLGSELFYSRTTTLNLPRCFPTARPRPMKSPPPIPVHVRRLHVPHLISMRRTTGSMTWSWLLSHVTYSQATSRSSVMLSTMAVWSRSHPGWELTRHVITNGIRLSTSVMSCYLGMPTLK